MFHRIIFLLLIVSSLSCNFNRCAVCFQSFSETLLAGVLKMPRISNAFEDYASVDSSCAQPPPPPGLTPRALAFFFASDGKFPGVGTLSCQIPRGGDEKRGQMLRPPSTLQHFSLIALSNSAVLSVLMCDFLF